jgi:diguanylate cyclase (GGDEF)-like protein
MLRIDPVRQVRLRAGRLTRETLERAGRVMAKPRLIASAPSEQLSLALGHFEHGVALWNAEERLVLANGRLADIFGLPEQSLVVGLAFRAFLVHAAESGCLEGRDPDGIYDLTMSLVHARKPVSFEDQLSSGRVVRVSYRPFADGGWLAVYEDVTERQRAQAQAAFLARHDPLTRLANRTLFHDRLGEALARIGTVAVLYLDLDRFKDVNDTLGHAVGDALLRLVSGRLNNCFRQTDTVARLGGDEFAVILSPGTREAATAVAHHVIEVIGRSFEVDGHDIGIATSVGIALAPDHGADAATLLKNADLALYAAKADGRATFRFFEQSMEERVQARRTLETDLRSALANDEFQLFYQPLVSARQRRAAGIEALLRWRHPSRGLVSPAEFIPIAESTRLIIPLGAWALRHACFDAARLPPGLRVSVNLSAIQLRSSDLLPTVREVLAASCLPPDRLELEVTESSLIRDAAATRATLQELRSLGVRIAMDDFGTGYSSLSYLREFPFDRIKIDKSFVDDVGRRKDCDAIIRAVTGIAESLGIETVAEGVETEEQLRRLVEEGCTEVQGYLFSRPVSLDDLPRVIAGIDRPV